MKYYKIIIYFAIAILALSMYYLLEFPFFKEWEIHIPILKKLSLAVAMMAFVLLIGDVLQKVIKAHTNSEGDQYNLLRITKLLTIVFILIIAASFLFQNLYAAAVSFGLISLVLGFALQAPITSFIAWLYIVFRRPYQVGHRIQINHMRGDVIEISYLETVLLECSGDYLGNDRQSGRVIYFPNSLILKEQVINYSGPQVPFIWNETGLQIAYTSDLSFVEKCLLEAANLDFKEQYPALDSNNGNDWRPAVYFRNNQYAWLEAVISYPVEPFDTTGRRNRILKYALPLLNAFPEKVQFPTGTMR